MTNAQIITTREADAIIRDANMELIKAHPGYADFGSKLYIHYSSMSGAFEPAINWSGFGSVSPLEAEEFAAALNHAVALVNAMPCRGYELD